ncbi:MAG TPA: DUF2169 domain-containing protein [Polyangiales bacterium]
MSAMRLLAAPGLGLAPLAGRLNFPGHSVTLIAKLKLQLVHAGVCQPLIEQPDFPTGDEPYPDDEDATGAPRYESDYAFYKPVADVLVVGSFHAPQAKPVKAGEVAVGVDNRNVRLSVIGRRRWYGSGGLPDANQAEPFTTLPLRWEQAFGGPGHTQNPTGAGYVAPERLTKEALNPRNFQREPLELPRIERPDKPFAYLEQQLDPVCLGPRARTWPVRRDLIGSCDERWLKTRWPWFPENFDARYFQAALPGLQQRDYLRGDEALRFRNLHPSIPEFQTQLPGLRALAAVQRKDASGVIKIEAVPLQLDTLWVDMDGLVAHLVWRGACQVRDADASDLVYAWSDLAPLGEPLGAEDVVRRAQAAIAAEEAKWAMEPEAAPAPEPPEAPEPPSAEPAMDPEIAALLAALPAPSADALPPISAEQQAQLDAGAQKAGEELDARLAKEAEEQAKFTPPPWTRERVRAARSSGGSLAGVDLSGLDLSGEDLSGADLTGTVLTGARLDAAVLRGAQLIGASLQGASLQGTDLRQAAMEDADLSESQGAGIKLEAAVLTRANLAGCAWSGVEFRGTQLAEVHAVGARLESATFVGAVLDEANFEAAQLQAARFESSSAQGTSFAKAQLGAAQLTDCKLKQADFSAAELSEARLTRCDLDDAHFEASQAKGAQFEDCTVGRLRAEAAEFGFAQLTRVAGQDAVFEAALFADAKLIGCALPGADFSGASLPRAWLTGSVLKHAKFGKADLSEAMLLGCDCFEATFEGARLTRCDGGGSSFFRAEFLDAEVADFYGQNRDLLGTKLAPAAG